MTMWRLSAGRACR